MNLENSDEQFEHEIERLSAVLVPYLCERTGLSSAQVTAVMDAQEEFWDNNPHVIGRMFIFGFPIEGDANQERD